MEHINNNHCKDAYLLRLVNTDTLPATDATQATHKVSTANLGNGVYQLIAKERETILYSGKLVITK